MAKVITFGEIMLRLATPGYLRFSQARQFEATFGGGEANVAVSLANYGLEAEFVTRFQKNGIEQYGMSAPCQHTSSKDEFLRGYQ